MPAPTSGPVSVTMRGPLFSKVITKEVEKAIMSEAMAKFEKRVRRKGRRVGRKRNPIGPGELTLGRGVTLVLTSTTVHPRTTGSAWTAKNVAAIKSMAPRVLRSVARKIVGELS